MVIRKTNRAELCAMSIVMGILFQCPVCAQTNLPGYRSPLISALPTPTQFRSHLGGGSGAGQRPVSNDIKELARALKYDPAIMYKFVHDYIDYELTWGDQKGSHMTWMDRSGNAFDQASLMIDLLKEAQDHGASVSNVNYVVGEIGITSSQLYQWLGITCDSDTVRKEALARAGLYGNLVSGQWRLIHVWVKATVDSVNYEFDPSYKLHSRSVGMYSSNNYLASGMGYNRTVFQTNATSGMDSEFGWIEGINRPNIESDLGGFVSNFKDEVADEAVLGEITLKDVIGGKTITPVDEESTLPAGMPYTIYTRDDIFAKSNVPHIYRTTLRVQYNGVDQTFNASDIYGRALTLSFDGSNPVLRLDGALVDTGNACTPGNEYDLDLTVDHADESNSLGQSSTLRVRAGGFYTILNGWGITGTHILASHRQALNTLIDSGSAMDSAPVLGHAYNLVGLSWLAQTSRMKAIASQIKSNSLPHHVFSHHVVGVVGEYVTPYLAIADDTFTLANQNSDDNKIKALFFAIADYASMYQEKIIQQLQQDTGISNVSLLAMGNDRSTYGKTFSDYNSNLEAMLSGYSQAEKDMISAYDAAGYTVTYPQYGDLTSGSWSGMGLDARKVSTTELNAVHLITGGQSASGTGGSAMDVDDVVELSDAGVYKQQDGVENASSTDLAIGTGSLPFGLTFSRSYSSANRFKDGPLGKGWTHNLDISIKVLSDSFRALESGSVYDVIPQIVGLYVSYDSYYMSSTWVNMTMISKVTAAWLGDSLTDNKVLVKQGSGGFSFARGPDGDYNPPVGTNIMLTTEADGSYRLRDTSGKFYEFDTNGRMEQWSDAHGNEVDWTYTGDKLTSVVTKIGGIPARSMAFTQPGDLITSVVDSAGRSISYGYDAKGQLIRHTNPDGIDVTYAYASGLVGCLAKVYSPDNPTVAVNTTVYDSLGRVKQKTNAVGSTWDYYLAYYRAETVLPAQLDPNDNMTRYSTHAWFDKYGQVLSAKDVMGRETTYSYDGIFRPTQVVGSSGMSTQYQYNEDHQVTNVISSAVSGSGFDPLEVVFGYDTYQNGQGRYFMKSNYTQDPAANATTYEYDFDNISLYGTEVGNLRKITYPEVTLPTGPVTPVETFTYYPTGQIETKTEKDGTVTKFYYDTAANGAVLKKTIADYGRLNITSEYTHDTAGRVITSKDPLGNITQAEYHASGLVKKVIPPDTSQYMTYEYFPSGLVQYVKHHSSSGVVYLQDKTYTTIGQLADVTGPYPANATSAQKEINYTQYQYDALGRIWKVTDAEGHITETRYTPDGKTWKVIAPNGQAQKTYTYNDNGQVSEVRDAKGNATQYTYNGFMGLARTTFEDGTYTEPGYNWLRQAETLRTRAGQTLEVEYDEWQRVKRKITPENTITYTYDIMGRITEVTDNHGTTVNTYDTAGRITQITDPKSRTVGYQYNAASQRTRLTYPDSTYVTYQYDPLGRTTHIKNASGTSLAQYAYDALSRYQTVTYANGATAQYAYDSASRLLSLTNTTNTQHEYEYTYDKVGNRLSMAVNDSQTHAYTYDNLYRVTNANYPPAYSFGDTQFQYDDVGNRHAVIATSTESYSVNSLNQYTQVDGNDFAYDDNGNLTVDSEFTYTYDSENRLKTVQKDASSNYGEISMAVDSDLEFTLGGDQDFSRSTTEFYYDGDSAYSGLVESGDEAWFETTVEGTGTISFYSFVDTESRWYKTWLKLFVDGYDKIVLNGKNDTWAQSTYTITTPGTHTLRWYTNATMGGDGAAYIDKIEWEPDNPPAGGGSGDGFQVITYDYDASGRRISKSVDDVDTEYFYDGDHCIVDYAENGSILRKYIYGPGVDQPIVMIDVADSSKSYYYHRDGLGSVIALSDAAGNTAVTYDYSIYGIPASSDPANPNPFLFTGRRFDIETGLYYYRARMYNPHIGRFLQTDPIGYGDGMNWYGYCGGNPIGRVDPSGTMTEEDYEGQHDEWFEDAELLGVPEHWDYWEATGKYRVLPRKVGNNPSAAYELGLGVEGTVVPSDTWASIGFTVGWSDVTAPIHIGNTSGWTWQIAREKWAVFATPASVQISIAYLMAKTLEKLTLELGKKAVQEAIGNPNGGYQRAFIEVRGYYHRRAFWTDSFKKAGKTKWVEVVGGKPYGVLSGARIGDDLFDPVHGGYRTIGGALAASQYAIVNLSKSRPCWKWSDRDE